MRSEFIGRPQWSWIGLGLGLGLGLRRSELIGRLQWSWIHDRSYIQNIQNIQNIQKLITKLTRPLRVLSTDIMSLILLFVGYSDSSIVLVKIIVVVKVRIIGVITFTINYRRD